MTHTEAEEVNPASWHGVWQSDGSDICFTAYLCKEGGHSTEFFKVILRLSLQVGERTLHNLICGLTSRSGSIS